MQNCQKFTFLTSNNNAGITSSIMCSKIDPKSKKKIAVNGTISQFFQPKAIVVKEEEEANDDIIEATPEKRPRAPLCTASNRFFNSTALEADKKRKGCYPDEIPELDVELPQRKKACNVKNGVKVLSLNDVSKEDFENYQCDLEKKRSARSRMPLTEIMKTPEKCRTSSGKKRTPLKLFEKSPKDIKEFKVEILQNFVKITPSKSGRKVCEWIEENHCASPSPSNRASAMKAVNETTPENKPSLSGRTPTSSKVKLKLDFTLSNTFVTVLPKTKESKVATPRKSPNLKALLLDDMWDEDFSFTESYSLDLSTHQHCTVVEVTSTSSNVKLVVKSTKNDEKAIVFITDSWLQTYLEVGSTISIQAYRNANDWYVDNKQGMLILEPDYLVSTTSIVGAIFCKRRCLLKDRFGGFDAQNKIMIVGMIVHSLLQESLKRRLQTEDAIRTVAQTILTSSRYINEIFYASLRMQEIADDVNAFVPNILAFMQQHLASGRLKSITPGNWPGRIDAIHDIEENIWCPTLGIKGKVDVSVKVGLDTLPLELKTGRASMSLEHRGQVILYVMMMNMLGYRVASGLLLYLRDGIIRDIPMSSNERRDLLILRNELAYYLTRKPKVNRVRSEAEIADIEDMCSPELPEPINHGSACARCEYNTLCGIYLRKEQWRIEQYESLHKLQPKLVGHLTDAHINYFHHWCGLLALENHSTEGKSFREIYVKTPDEREKHGRCLSNMKVCGDISELNGVYSTTFVHDEQASCSSSSSLMNTTSIAETEYVVVSTKTRPAIATGIVSRMDSRSITIGLDRDLRKRFQKTVFILDTYDSTTMNGFNYTNLALLLACDERATHLRKLIIDLDAPLFKRTLPRSVGMKASVFLKNMNAAQQRAIIKAVAAQDYLLIKGMPGTGKTATIVTLVRVLVELGYSVLITSHTNSAVDNVCLRLLDCGVKLLRLGAEARIHTNLKKCSEHSRTRNCKTPEELDQIYNEANVVAVTCLGSKHQILSKRKFDFCIIDESTQVLQCSVIRALHSCKTFILIGDPDQLPPTVKNKDALERGMSESLFARLESKVEATITLQLNYRMNKTITELANKLTYQGKLMIANDNVGNANLRLNKFEGLNTSFMDRQWVLNALSDQLDKAVFILDTGPVWNKSFQADWMKTNSYEDYSISVNPSECAIIVILVDALIKGGVLAGNIGVIAPYKVQVAQLATLLQSFDVDVNTVDQFQGKDKEVILYSCTKSRDITQPQRRTKFEILEDQRRLTVAITRAKHKLIILADVGTIKEFTPFRKLFSYIDEECYMELIEGTNGFSWEGVLKDCGDVISHQ